MVFLQRVLWALLSSLQFSLVSTLDRTLLSVDPEGVDEVARLTGPLFLMCLSPGHRVAECWIFGEAVSSENNSGQARIIF